MNALFNHTLGKGLFGDKGPSIQFLGQFFDDCHLLWCISLQREMTTQSVKCKIVEWLPLKFEKKKEQNCCHHPVILRTYASLTFKTCSRDANEKAARNTNGYRWIGQPPFWGGWVRVIKIDQISFIIVAKFSVRSSPLLFSIDFLRGWKKYIYV